MDDKTPQLLPVTSDFVFKLIFGDQRNTDILAEFLKAVLDIPESEYESITVADPHVKKERLDDKYGILDVKIRTKSGNVVNVEIQVIEIPEMKHRSVYVISKMVTEQMSAGRNHSDLRRSVSIIITSFELVKENKHYHNQFRYRSHQDGAEFTDLTEINTLELPKLPRQGDSSELWYWLRFIKTGDEEELNMLAERNPQMSKAVGVLKELSADEETRRLYERRELARRDMVSRMEGALRKGIGIGKTEGKREGKKEGRIEEKSNIARNMLKANMPLAQIASLTGLSRDEINALR